MRYHLSRTTGRWRPRGLSSLEMVLCLPLLLGIMALMVVFALAIDWKVRGLTVSRHVLWSSRWPRAGAHLPRPANWPDEGQVRAGLAGDVPELDDPRVDLPVARGPLPNGNRVRRRLLDPVRGLCDAAADLERELPVMPRLGPYCASHTEQFLGNKWQHQRTGCPNRSRRSLVLYTFAEAPERLEQAYVNAALAVSTMPGKENLAPLDRDPEFIAYGRRFGWGGAPNFLRSVRLGTFCSLSVSDAAEVARNLVDRIQGKIELDENGNVVRRIPSLAERMTRAFIRLYRRVIQALEHELNSLDPDHILEGAAIRREIRQLERKIETLEQFLETLRGHEGFSEPVFEPTQDQP